MSFARRLLVINVRDGLSSLFLLLLLLSFPSQGGMVYYMPINSGRKLPMLLMLTLVRPVGKTLAYTSIRFTNEQEELVARGSHTK